MTPVHDDGGLSVPVLTREHGRRELYFAIKTVSPTPLTVFWNHPVEANVALSVNQPVREAFLRWPHV